MPDQISITGALWESTGTDDALCHQFQDDLALSPIASQCAASRWTTPPALDLNESCLHDPYLINGMDLAVPRLKKAVQNKQRIRIITDYDVDGTTSSLILQSALHLSGKGFSLDYHIPNRFNEGYGFSIKAANKAITDKVDLIITADIGIRDHEAVKTARDGGVDVLICDHHISSGDTVPNDAIVLCPPQQSCDYPNPSLAACGVSFKLAQALLEEHPKRDKILRSLLKLAAIGTVADLVSLNSDENRAIVEMGLQELNRGPHQAGLTALLEVSGVEHGHIKTYDLGFRLGPRINAAGRLADASMIIELLTSRDYPTAKQMAERLDALNSERRSLQDRITKLAMEQVTDPPPPFILVAGAEKEGWHRGIVGIVASRLKDEFNRPCAVVSIQGEEAVGSMRSIDGVHAVNCLESAKEYLIRFGGHPKAAGFSVKADNLNKLSEQLQTYVTQHTSSNDFIQKYRYDAEISHHSLNNKTRLELLKLGPFGMGNPQPRLLIRGVNVEQLEIKGATGSLVKFHIRTPDQPRVEAIWWGKKEYADELLKGPVDLLGSLQVNRWRGRETLQIKIEDVRHS